jgi:hypothetical protein
LKLAPVRISNDCDQSRSSAAKLKRSRCSSSSQDSHGSLSGDESAEGSEQPPNVRNTIVFSESCAKLHAARTPMSDSHSTDRTMVSPSSCHLETIQSASPPPANDALFETRKERSPKLETEYYQQLPPLSDMFKTMSPPPDGKPYHSPTLSLSANPSRGPSFPRRRTPTPQHGSLSGGHPAGLLNTTTNRMIPSKESSSLPIHSLLAASGDEQPYYSHPSPLLNVIPRLAEPRNAYSTQHLRSSLSGNGIAMLPIRFSSEGEG